VYVGYSSGTAKDGSNGKSSTIAEFTSNAVLLGAASVLGHNDGLRYDVATNQIWSMQRGRKLVDHSRHSLNIPIELAHFADGEARNAGPPSARVSVDPVPFAGEAR
jgi:hypothetical protein